MPLPSSGQIDMNQIQTEFGGTPQIGLNEYYKGGPYVTTTDNAPNVPTGGQIALSNFWGAAKVNIDITVPGLRLLYDFGRTSSYPGSGSTVYDISGWGRNGTFYNGTYVQYDWNGVSQNGNKSYAFFDGIDDFISMDRFLQGFSGSTEYYGCLSGRGPFTMCFWIKALRTSQIEVITGTVNDGFRDIVQFSTNRTNRDDYQFRTIHRYVRDTIDDGDYGYSVHYNVFNNPFSASPCFFTWPNDIFGQALNGGWCYVCWNVTDSYYDVNSGFNYLRVYKFANSSSQCGYSNFAGTTVQYQHEYPSSFYCFQYPMYLGTLNRRGSPFRFFQGHIGQVHIYNRALSTGEMDYNFEQHRNRYL